VAKKKTLQRSQTLDCHGLTNFSNSFYTNNNTSKSSAISNEYNGTDGKVKRKPLDRRSNTIDLCSGNSQDNIAGGAKFIRLVILVT